jgi:splicing factor 3B subunit 3
VFAPAGVVCALLLQGFCSEQCPEGFVAVVKNTLRILMVENIGETFNQTPMRLRYTPRRLAIHPGTNTLIIAESDHAAIPLVERTDLEERLGVSGRGCLGGGGCMQLLWDGWRRRRTGVCR